MFRFFLNFTIDTSIDRPYWLSCALQDLLGAGRPVGSFFLFSKASQLIEHMQQSAFWNGRHLHVHFIRPVTRTTRSLHGFQQSSNGKTMRKRLDWGCTHVKWGHSENLFLCWFCYVDFMNIRSTFIVKTSPLSKRDLERWCRGFALKIAHFLRNLQCTD